MTLPLIQRLYVIIELSAAFGVKCCNIPFSIRFHTVFDSVQQSVAVNNSDSSSSKLRRVTTVLEKLGLLTGVSVAVADRTDPAGARAGQIPRLSSQVTANSQHVSISADSGTGGRNRICASHDYHTHRRQRTNT